MNKDSIYTIYNRHIRKARAHAKNTTGMERASLIADYFIKQTDHPHPQFTYEKFMMDRTNDYSFAIELMQHMASLCAENESL